MSLSLPQAEPQAAHAGEEAAQHAAAVAAATVVLNEASASALADVMSADGISEEQRAIKVAEERQKRMQELLYAITVLASSSGGHPASYSQLLLGSWMIPVSMCSRCAGRCCCRNFIR